MVQVFWFALIDLERQTEISSLIGWSKKPLLQSDLVNDFKPSNFDDQNGKLFQENSRDPKILNGCSDKKLAFYGIFKTTFKIEFQNFYFIN